jgi:hypothetical protein
MKSAFEVLLLFLCSTGVVAQTYCSLVVKVVDPNDREVPEAQVTLEERSGRVVNAENQRGGVRFCDLGLQPVTITVGSPQCNQVCVREVPLEWGRTKIVKVVYDREPCLRDFPPVAACTILFRFSNESGKWISGVIFDPPVSGAEHPRSDNFGRALVSIAAGKELRTSAKRQGYVSEEVRLTCTRDLMFTERVIKLRPLQ